MKNNPQKSAHSYQGGQVIDPGRFNGVADVLIDKAELSRVGPHLKAPAGATKIDATGRLVLPGFVDLHVHFREPGFEYKETIQSGARQRWPAGSPRSVACPIRIPSMTTKR